MNDPAFFGYGSLVNLGLMIRVPRLQGRLGTHLRTVAFLSVAPVEGDALLGVIARVPILNDRADPIYPRHQTLSIAECKLVDDNLKRYAKNLDNLVDSQPNAA